MWENNLLYLLHLVLQYKRLTYNKPNQDSNADIEFIN